MTRELQRKADISIIVCGGDECSVVYAKHVEEWNIQDRPKCP